jgi:hypothetical protein
MDAICFSETSVETWRTTHRRIPEDDTLHNHRCENLKSYNSSIVACWFITVETRLGCRCLAMAALLAFLSQYVTVFCEIA